MSTLPIGIGWKRDGDTVVGHVIEIDKTGQRNEILRITYTLEQAAETAKQLLAAIQSSARGPQPTYLGGAV